MAPDVPSNLSVEETP